MEKFGGPAPFVIQATDEMQKQKVSILSSCRLLFLTLWEQLDKRGYVLLSTRTNWNIRCLGAGSQNRPLLTRHLVLERLSW